MEQQKLFCALLRENLCDLYGNCAAAAATADACSEIKSYDVYYVEMLSCCFAGDFSRWKQFHLDANPQLTSSSCSLLLLLL
jgi:hypothetical protein